MKLLSQVTCGICGKSHRIHRRLKPGTRYRFSCKRCGAQVTFNSASVRWACKPDGEMTDSMRRTLSGRATVAHGDDEAAPADATVPATAPALPPAAVPPPIPARASIAPSRQDRPAPSRQDRPAPSRQDRRPVHDTMMDGRPPIHLSPLLRRGVPVERESSRVRWLRERVRSATG